MSSALLVSWAITVVGEFDAAGRRIPEGVIPLLPMVPVVLWAREQSRPLQAEAIQAAFGLSRATAYRWMGALEDIDDPAAAKRRLPAGGRVRDAVRQELAQLAGAKGGR